MPTIRFKKTRYPPVAVDPGAFLMASLLKVGMPVASSCQGKGACSKCRLEILEGSQNLSQETPLELELRLRNKLSPPFRISCQTQIFGDILIDASYW